MRGINNAVLSILFVLMPVMIFAQNGGFNPGFHEFNNIGGGARALGMGGAYLGISDDEMAYSWNPAGMLAADKGKIGAQAVSVSDKFAYSWAQRPSFYADPNIQLLDAKREHFNINYVGLVAPFEWLDRQWAAGGGYRNVYDMILDWSSTGFDSSENSFSQNRGVDAVSIAIAGDIMSGVSAGLTLNSYVRNSESNLILGNYDRYFPPSQDTIVVDVWEDINAHYSGVNLDLGLYGDFGMVSGGFVLHTPYDLKENVKWSRGVIVPPEPFGLVDRYTATYNMPISYSLGIAARPMEKLTVAIDFDSRPMSKVEAKYDFEQLVYTDTTVDMELEDLNQFRIGAEYVLDAGFADIPVRFGFRNQPSTSTELLEATYDTLSGTWNNTRGDQRSANIISFGTGLHFDRIWFDLAYQFGSSSYNRTVTYTESTVYEIKNDYSRLVISSGMYF